MQKSTYPGKPTSADSKCWISPLSLGFNITKFENYQGIGVDILKFF